MTQLGQIIISALIVLGATSIVELALLNIREEPIAGEFLRLSALIVILGQLMLLALLWGASLALAVLAARRFCWLAKTKLGSTAALRSALGHIAALVSGFYLAAGLFFLGCWILPSFPPLWPRLLAILGLLGGYIFHRLAQRLKDPPGQTSLIWILALVLSAVVLMLGILSSRISFSLLWLGFARPLFYGCALGCWLVSGLLGVTIWSTLVAEWRGGWRYLRWVLCGGVLWIGGALLVVIQLLYVGLFPTLRAWVSLALAAAMVLGLFNCLVPTSLFRRWTSHGLVCLLLVLAAVGLILTCLGFDLRRRPASSQLLGLSVAGTLRVAIEPLFDLDRDGAIGSWASGPDCNDLDQRVNPGQREVLDSDQDENCNGGQANTRSMARWQAALAVQQKKVILNRSRLAPHITHLLLITVDALRPDHLNEQDAPNIAALAREGTRFARCVAPSTYTTLSLAAMLRGRYVASLKLSPVLEGRDLCFYLPGEKMPTHITPFERFLLPIRDPSQELPQLLQVRGMRKVAILDTFLGGLLLPRFGFGRGFDQLIHPRACGEGLGAEKVTQLARSALDQGASSLFLWVHYFETHTPPEGNYRKGLAVVDRQIGLLIKEYHQRQLWPRTLVILTSDHGEYLGEKGRRGHGFSVDELLTHVPLIIKGPKIKLQCIEQTVSTIDILPTLLDLFGLPLSDQLHGFSLAGQLHGLAVARPPPVLSEAWLEELSGTPKTRMFAIYRHDQKLIYDALRAYWQVVDFQPILARKTREQPQATPFCRPTKTRSYFLGETAGQRISAAPRALRDELRLWRDYLEAQSHP